MLNALHISLNFRECVLLQFHSIFAELFSFFFGHLDLLEVIYGGWTLIRDTIMAAFPNCKDIEYLTLVLVAHRTHW